MLPNLVSAEQYEGRVMAIFDRKAPSHEKQNSGDTVV